MVLSWAANHKISVNGNTPVAAIRHRFSHLCKRLGPRSHGTIKTATRRPPRAVRPAPKEGTCRTLSRQCRIADVVARVQGQYLVTGEVCIYRIAPVVGGFAGGVAPPYCSREYRACRGVRGVNVRCPYGSGKPQWLALSLLFTLLL